MFFKKSKSTAKSKTKSQKLKSKIQKPKSKNQKLESKNQENNHHLDKKQFLQKQKPKTKPKTTNNQPITKFLDFLKNSIPRSKASNYYFFIFKVLSTSQFSFSIIFIVKSPLFFCFSQIFNCHGKKKTYANLKLLFI